jgi:hypothetical protein
MRLAKETPTHLLLQTYCEQEEDSCETSASQRHLINTFALQDINVPSCA